MSNLCSSRSGHNEARDLKTKIREKKTAKIIDGYSSPSRGVEQVSVEIERVLSLVSML